MRMHARGSHNARITVGQRECRVRSGPGLSDCDDMRNAGCPRSLEHGGPVARKRRIREVAMGVDQQGRKGGKEGKDRKIGSAG